MPWHPKLSIYVLCDSLHLQLFVRCFSMNELSQTNILLCCTYVFFFFFKYHSSQVFRDIACFQFPTFSFSFLHCLVTFSKW